MHSLLVVVLLPEVWMSLFITFSFDAFTPLGHFCVHVFTDSLLLVFLLIFFWYDPSDFYVPASSSSCSIHFRTKTIVSDVLVYSTSLTFPVYV